MIVKKPIKNNKKINFLKTYPKFKNLLKIVLK